MHHVTISSSDPPQGQLAQDLILGQLAQDLNGQGQLAQGTITRQLLNNHVTIPDFGQQKEIADRLRAFQRGLLPHLRVSESLLRLIVEREGKQRTVNSPSFRALRYTESGLSLQYNIDTEEFAKQYPRLLEDQKLRYA